MTILAIYDNPEFCDRYSVYIDEVNRHNGLYDCLSLSGNCNSVMGVSQWSMGELGDHNGEKIEMSALPLHVQEHIEERLQCSN